MQQRRLAAARRADDRDEARRRHAPEQLGAMAFAAEIQVGLVGAKRPQAGIRLQFDRIVGRHRRNHAGAPPNCSSSGLRKSGWKLPAFPNRSRGGNPLASVKAPDPSPMYCACFWGLAGSLK